MVREGFFLSLKTNKEIKAKLLGCVGVLGERQQAPVSGKGLGEGLFLVATGSGEVVSSAESPLKGRVWAGFDKPAQEGFPQLLFFLFAAENEVISEENDPEL